MLRIGIILGSTRPGRNTEAVARWVVENAQQRAEPHRIEFCDRPPPIVADAPESGPQKGVRTPCGSSAAYSASQVQPASTVTYMSAVLTSTTRESPRVSTITHDSRSGANPAVYDVAPPRATTE